MASVTLSASTIANDSSYGGSAWSNPTNAGASDNTYTSWSGNTSDNSYYLLFTNFGFSVPSGATIDSITVNVERKITGGAATDDRIRLSKAGVIQAIDKASGDSWPATDQVKSYGADLWGDSWTHSDINNTGFGVAVAVQATATATDVLVDHVEITVQYHTEYEEIASGGSVLSGFSTVQDIFFSSGGVETSGIGDDTSYYYFNDIEGGLEAAKGAIYNVVRDIIATGGMTVGGDSVDQTVRTIVGSGGASAGTEALVENPVYHYPNVPEHDPVVILDSLSNIGANYPYVARGGINVSNEEKVVSDRGYNYIADESGASLDGDAFAQSSFTINLDFNWRVRSQFIIERTFKWDTGQLRRFFYRITGKNNTNICDPLRPEECCMTFVTNIQARTVSDLCEKLKERKWNWPIDKVEKFTKPSDISDINEDAENGITYNGFCTEPVEICDNIVCAEFCVDSDPVESIGVTTMVQVNAFLTHESDGDSLVIGGEAETSYDITPFEEFYISEGGNVVIGGAANVVSSDYQTTSAGEVTISGTYGNATSSSWHYLGGEYPYFINAITPTESTQFDGEVIDVAWNLTDRSLQDDGVFATADVSFLKATDFLVVKGFNFNLIPDDSNVVKFKFRISRQATQGLNVSDEEVYLVYGNEIISNNLAKTTSYWPSSEAEKEYVTAVDYSVDSSANVDYYEDGWITSEIKDPEFGIAIRAKSTVSIQPMIAMIDSVEIDVYYESADNQRLIVSGTIDLISSAYQHPAEGGVNVTGEGLIGGRVGWKYNVSGGVSTSGQYGLNFNYSAEDGVEIGGEAVSHSSFVSITGEAGATVSGSADIAATTYSYVPTITEVVLSNEEEVTKTATYNYKPDGDGVSVEGEAVGPLLKMYFESTDGVSIDGEAGIRSSAWSYISDGNAVFLLGDADLNFSDYGTVEETIGFVDEIIEVNFLFGTDVEMGDLTSVSQTVTRCGCTDMPLEIEINNNLAVNNKLSQFLVRNGLAISKRLSLYHNKINDSWQTNLHYKGLSGDSNTLETWNIVFELQCTNIIGGSVIGEDVWKLSMYIQQKNQTTLEDFDTRMVLGFRKDKACSSGEFDVKATYNTQLDIVTLDPDTLLYYNVLYDDIDLFKNQYWENNPNFIIEVSSIALDQEITRINLSSSVLI